MADELSVLIVDDSRSLICQLSNAIAEFEGVHLVGTACDGVAAIRMVSELRPHLVLMDIVMPGMDGLAALRALRANHPEVQVAMVSAVGGSESRAQEAFRLGAVQVVGKPFDTRVLAALFESARRRVEEEA